MQTLTAAIQNDILAEMGVFKSDDVTIEEKSSFAVADLQEAKARVKRARESGELLDEVEYESGIQNFLKAL